MNVVWVYFAGRAFRSEGYFDEAKHCFERCYAVDGLHESKRILVESSLADLCSELDYSHPGGWVTPELSFFDHAEGLVGPELERLRTSARRVFDSYSSPRLRSKSDEIGSKTRKF